MKYFPDRVYFRIFETDGYGGYLPVARQSQTVNRPEKEGEKMEKELLLKIHVQCQEPMVVRGQTRDIVMIPFTGTAEGPYFRGTIEGAGVDTQKIPKGGEPFLSARYLIHGKDDEGRECQVFIENEGSADAGFTPMIVTDSPLLARWETTPLKAEVEGISGGVLVRIFEAEK